MVHAKKRYQAIKPWPPAGFHVMIKPRGSICNLNCEYCFYLSKKELYPGSSFKMDEKTLEKFTMQYIRAQKVPEVVFGWQGGEPMLMGLEFFRKAVEFQEKYKKPGMKILNAFQTNGTLITDEWAQFFHDNSFLIGISIDGPPELHDAYRKDRQGNGTHSRVMKGIHLLDKHDVEYNILTCVNNLNAERPLAVYRYFRDEIHASFVQFIPIIEKRGGELGEGKVGNRSLTTRSVSGKQYGKFLNAIFDEWVQNDVGRMFIQIFDVSLGAWVGRPGGLCIFAKTCGDALALEHNGDLYACDHFVKPTEKRGNIMKNQLINLVASRDQMKFGLRKENELPSPCRACKWLFACNGGCIKNRVDKSPENGDPFFMNHLCDGYKAFFSHVDPYMRFMAGELRERRPAFNIMTFLKEHDISELK
ncbi:MAG: anaerobic sulfatase maturase [Promethearchaeota archaeon]